MANDNNSINSNWNVGTSANGGNENVLEEQSEQQPPVKKSRMDDTSEGEPAENAIQHDGATNEVQIRELEISTMDKKGELNGLKLEMIALKDEFDEKLAPLEERYQKEIAELKMKNQKLTEEFEEKIKKLEERVQMNQQKIGEAENQIMVQIHEMKVQLPLENWHDLLAFVPRSQLGNVVSQIGDYYFADIIQSYLHDPVKEITLGNIRIIAPRPYVTTDLPMVRVWPNAATNIPDWPMPGNIKDFKQIDMNYGYLDTSVLHFLGKFQENSLLTDVNLYIDYHFEVLFAYKNDTVPQALIKIAPFITSIDSITFPKIDLFELVYDNDDDDEASKPQLLKKIMAKTRVLSTDSSIYDRAGRWRSDQIEWCCSWLYTPRNDGKPRMLKSNYPINNTHCASFVEHIKKDFEKANNAVSFIICTRVKQSGYTVEDISLENIKTNEQLVIKTNRDDVRKWHLLISRYPLNAAKSVIEADKKEIVEWNRGKLNRKINMEGELTEICEINHNLKLEPDE